MIRQTDEHEVARLAETINLIGLARFVSRINAGVIGQEEGLEAIKRFVSAQKRRPLLSKLTHAVLGRADSFSKS